MDEVSYFANLRQLNKLRGVLEEWRISILELEMRPNKDELTDLYIHKKQLERQIDEFHYKRLLKVVKEYETSKGIQNGV